MQKILLALDATNLCMNALDFACYLGRLTHSKVTGVFLENLVADEQPVLMAPGATEYIDWELDSSSEEYRVKRALIDKNITLFKQACESRSVRCAVHRDRGVPAKEIINESRFADLIVTDAATSFSNTYDGVPTGFVKDLLKDAECPVIIAPESWNGIDEIVFAYSDTRSSVFAIRQFTYLFPQLSDKKITVLQVNEKGEWADIDKYNLREWLKDHYQAIGFEAIKGDVEDGLFDYLFKRKNVFIVMGAYGRSAASRFFKHSHADRLIKTITQPLFISHY